MTNKHFLSEDEYKLVEKQLEAYRAEKTAGKKQANEAIQKAFDAFVDLVYDYYDKYQEAPQALISKR